MNEESFQGASFLGSMMFCDVLYETHISTGSIYKALHGSTYILMDLNYANTLAYTCFSKAESLIPLLLLNLSLHKGLSQVVYCEKKN